MSKQGFYGDLSSRVLASCSTLFLALALLGGGGVMHTYQKTDYNEFWWKMYFFKKSHLMQFSKLLPKEGRRKKETLFGPRKAPIYRVQSRNSVLYSIIVIYFYRHVYPADASLV